MASYGLERSLRIFEQIILDAGMTNLSAQARQAGIPVPSIHRIAAALADSGFLTLADRGRYVAGPVFLKLIHAVDPILVLKERAQLVLRDVARMTGRIAHLGVLEDEMVTYLLKIGHGSATLFTRSEMQLEAYCSAIGKVLLAYLDTPQLDRYLLNGPFVKLTSNTTIDPEQLRHELEHVRLRSYAIDNEEIEFGLFCVAVPIFWPDGKARAAISLSDVSRHGAEGLLLKNVAILRQAADQIVLRMFNENAKPRPQS